MRMRSMKSIMITVCMTMKVRVIVVIVTPMVPSGKLT